MVAQRAFQQAEEKHTHFTQIPNYLIEDEPWALAYSLKGRPVKFVQEGARILLFKLIKHLAPSRHRYIGFSERELARKLGIDQSVLNRTLPILRDLQMVNFGRIEGKFVLKVHMDMLWHQNTRFYARQEEAQTTPQRPSAIDSFFAVTPDVHEPQDDVPAQEHDVSPPSLDAFPHQDDVQSPQIDADCINFDTGASSKMGGNSRNTKKNTKKEEGEEEHPAEHHSLQGTAPTPVFSHVPSHSPSVQDIASTLRLPVTDALCTLVQTYQQQYPTVDLLYTAQEARGYADEHQSLMSVDRYRKCLQFQAQSLPKQGPRSSDSPSPWSASAQGSATWKPQVRGLATTEELRNTSVWGDA